LVAKDVGRRGAGRRASSWLVEVDSFADASERASGGHGATSSRSGTSGSADPKGSLTQRGSPMDEALPAVALGARAAALGTATLTARRPGNTEPEGATRGHRSSAQSRGPRTDEAPTLTIGFAVRPPVAARGARSSPGGAQHRHRDERHGVVQFLAEGTRRERLGSRSLAAAASLKGPLRGPTAALTAASAGLGSEPYYGIAAIRLSCHHGERGELRYRPGQRGDCHPAGAPAPVRLTVPERKWKSRT